MDQVEPFRVLLIAVIPDPGCLSHIPGHDFFFSSRSRIKQQKYRGEYFFSCLDLRYFFVVIFFIKLLIIFLTGTVQKKTLQILTNN